jgi:hypothetical protein
MTFKMYAYMCNLPTSGNRIHGNLEMSKCHKNHLGRQQILLLNLTRTLYPLQRDFLSSHGAINV